MSCRNKSRRGRSVKGGADTQPNVEMVNAPPVEENGFLTPRLPPNEGAASAAAAVPAVASPAGVPRLVRHNAVGVSPERIAAIVRNAAVPPTQGAGRRHKSRRHKSRSHKTRQHKSRRNKSHRR